MIADTIHDLIKRMKNIRMLEEIKANNEQQQKADESYRSMVKEVDEFVRAYAFAKGRLRFTPTETLESDLKVLLSQLKELVASGIVDIEAAREAQKRYTHLKSQMRTEWGTHFSSFAPTVETLRVIEGIDPARVKKCLADIQPAKAWSTSKASLEKLANALDDSSELIGELDLDDSIIMFLQKMTSGNARVSDLSYDLILWMKKEKIEDKVSLSFVL